MIYMACWYSFHHHRCSTVSIALTFLVFIIGKGVSSSSFTFVNKCDYPVWPGILGSPKLDSTGFHLPQGASRSFLAPTGWSGRFWGRTSCSFDSSGHGSCSTGDCGSGQLECNGAGATPPTTLAEFTLGSGSMDFYDVSLVDGYNLPMMVEPTGGQGSCLSTGCLSDLNSKCPEELRAEGGAACRSACEAFGNPEYCCSGAYSSPATCKPTMYSQVFKTACPRSYSYAYDDATSTFTCTAPDYTITFCPNLTRTWRYNGNWSANGTNGVDNEAGSDQSGALAGSGSSVEQSQLATAWMAELATADSTAPRFPWIWTTTSPSLILSYYILLILW